MKNKLLTTALVTSMVGAGTAVSVAQTTVSGNLDLSYMALSAKGTTSGINSFRGYGRESQINLANKGKLNVGGMEYAAGFSLEFDGPDTGATGMWEENVFINFISGNTTITFGSDHIQNPDTNPTMLSGIGYLRQDATINIGGTPTAVTGLYSAGANSPYSAYGMGIMQRLPGIGTFSAYYAPSRDTNSGALNDIFNSSTAIMAEPAATRGTAESAYELGFRGDLGVKGLNTWIFYNKADRRDRVESGSDEKGKRVAATYTTGPFTIAGDYSKTEGTNTGIATVAGVVGEDINSKSVGLGYAVSKDLSLSATYAKAEPSAVVTDRTNADEKIKVLALGYSLGPVSLQVMYKETDNIAGYSGADSTALSTRLSTRF